MIKNLFRTRYLNSGIVLGTLLLLSACEKKASPEATLAFNNIIPKPISATADGGAFILNEQTSIRVDASPEVSSIGTYLADKLNPATGFNLSVSQNDGTEVKNAIVLSTNAGDAELGDEGYSLVITANVVKLTANKPAGLFYGVQTLRQLLPAKIESGSSQAGVNWEIATGTIRDYPSYGWRGSMLDVARHFFGMDDVKRYIDLISHYKMNVLHLHLSDDQGWRIEIKSWPNLTTIGGSTQVGGGKGGFYTQDQYKELVAYAQSRFITIIPEIDLPGHINSALASYGELNGGTIVPEEGRVKAPVVNQEIISGKSKNKPTDLYSGIEVGWSTLRVEKPESFKFVEDVLKELASITPGPYLHIGGDEAHVTKKEDYIVFINRFSEMVKNNGKKMIGWEEIAQANIDDNAIAQHWANEEHASAAAAKGAKIIMSPSTRVYLDMQYDSLTKLGLHWAAYIEVDDAYSWDPADQVDGIGRDQIVGVEAPLWSETISNMEEIEYLLFPRLPGIAEVGWSRAEGKSWDEYKTRLGLHGNRMTTMGINYYKSPLVSWNE
jgi:hexosaminidase